MRIIVNKVKAVIFSLLAAVFYATSIPASKVLLDNISPTMLAGFLYLGAGIGIGILSLVNKKTENNFTSNDTIYIIGMIILDIIAPIFLMLGIKYSPSSNVSLLVNFEIVATALIAFLVFKEKISFKLLFAIILITIAGILLSFNEHNFFKLSYGSLFVLLATTCWGLENNCTRKIASKNTYNIVILKGFFSGIGAIIIALMLNENFPDLSYITIAIFLGFIAYGLSIFLYIKSQDIIGAAQTSAYYAIAPFVGSFFSFIFLDEEFTEMYFISLTIMLVGTTLIIIDTLIVSHNHNHSHTFIYNQNGEQCFYIITHTHIHNHLVQQDIHKHRHQLSELMP